MKKIIALALAILVVGLSALYAQTARPVKVKMQSYKVKKCVKPNSCVEISLSWPVLSGGNTQAVSAINDSIRKVVYGTAEADPVLPLPRALDTAADSALAMLKEQLAGMDGYDMGYFYELESKVLLNNGRFFSVSMSNFTFAGGAHPNTYAQVATYDLKTGRVIPLTEIIGDTLALRTLLEKQFIKEKSEPGQPVPALSDILFDEHLAMPENYAIVKEGVYFIYNPYEVAAYVFGPTHITLSWTQLGSLADRKKWQ